MFLCVIYYKDTMKSAISSGKYLSSQQNSHLGTKYSYKSMQVYKTCKIQTNILQEKRYKPLTL